MLLKGNEANTLPKIFYDEVRGYVKISGRSVSLEINDYFEEFLDYFNHYTLKNPSNLTLDVDCEYFNTQSARLIIQFLKAIKQIEKKGFIVTINWYLDEEDDDQKDVGKDLESIIEIPFNFIEKINPES